MRGLFDQEEFNKFIIDSNVVGFFPEGKTLKSGRFSYWYANCRNLTDTVGSAENTSDFLINFIDDNIEYFDFIFGVPAGVTKLADIANYKIGMAGDNPDHPLVIGRESAKIGHGDSKDAYFIGPVNKGDQIVVVEDVTTTGGSMLKTLDQLKGFGADVVGVVALVNRMEFGEDGKRSVADLVAEKGSKYYAMSTADQLIPLAVAKYKPSEEFLKKFQDNYNESAISKINVI